MKRQYRFPAVIFCLVFLVCLSTVVAHSENRIHTMTGKISALNLPHDTVVIQVPLGSQMFTVGGPIDADATLTKNGRSVELKDFNVGETATVTWRTTLSGHQIQSLTVR